MEPDLEDEVRLVTAAQEHLRRREPLAAMEFIAQWEARFGQSGQLKQEALAARIIALCDSGQPEAARPEASQYFAWFPTSPHRDRIERRCAFPQK